MGSQIVQAMVIQRGSAATNPGGLAPNPSNPIEQRSGPVTSPTTESLLEQRAAPVTAEVAAESTSAPIEQRQGDSFSTPTTEPPNDAIIEQKSVITADEEHDGTILQLIFTSVSLSQVPENLSTRPIEQRGLERNTPSEPLEQTAALTDEESIEQFLFIQNVFPPCGSTKNPVSTNLLWRILDFGGDPYDVATISFVVNGVEVQDTSAFTATILEGGLRMLYDPPSDFDYDSIVEVFVQVSDTADPPNTFHAVCNFSTVPDTRPPIVENVVPTCWSAGVSVTADVEFDVRDVGLGVDVDSITLNIEGLPVCSGLSFDSLVTTSGNGYHVTWEHPEKPFVFDSNVTVTIAAADLSPQQNSTLFICGFDTEESEIPVFTNFYPGPCDTFVDTNTGLYFEVYGVEHGVDISTLEVFVDNARRKVYVRPRILRSE